MYNKEKKEGDGMNGEAAFRRYADFDAILNSIYCAIFIVHTDGCAVYRNGAADELKAELGVTEDALIGALEAQIDVVHGQGRFAVAVGGGHDYLPSPALDPGRSAAGQHYRRPYIGERAVLRPGIGQRHRRAGRNRRHFGGRRRRHRRGR